jgi:segregation and condensation protein A
MVRAEATAPDWLYHHLTVSGPASAVATFAAAARGSGIIPWQLDFADIEEDVFLRAVSQPAGRRSLTVEGCRILARQFRLSVEARQARAVALVGQSLACPFDLHVLLPVPATILLLGPGHPSALAWLAANWGTTERLRQVTLREKPTTGRRLPKDHAVIGYGFFTYGETPHTLDGAAIFAASSSGRLSRMTGIADPDVRLDKGSDAERDGHLDGSSDHEPVGGPGRAIPRVAGQEEPGEGQPGTSPILTLDGYTGPLDRLLTLARAQQIDLSDLPLTALLDQLAAALRQAPAVTSLAQKADWVVMAAWLVQLRARLLLPADAAAQQEAASEAGRLREQLMALREIKALAFWLESRPQLGHDVFARGQPEVFGVSVDPAHGVDVVAFLWASLALFDVDGPPDTATVYRLPQLELHTVAEAHDRILQRLAKMPGGGPLVRFLPDPDEGAQSDTRRALRRRSAWSSTLIASLELARQGEVVLGQEASFGDIEVASAGGAADVKRPKKG